MPCTVPSFTTKNIDADGEAVFFGLFSAVRAEELGMQSWDPILRDQILRLQFAAQRSAYRQQFPGLVEQFIMRDGQPIGWIMVSRGEAVRCVDLAILGEERRRGAATRVLRDMQDEAASSGVPLVLSVLRTNAAAIALYNRLGFLPAGKNESHTFMEWRRDQQVKPAASGAATFRPHVDTTFVADPGAREIPLRLAEVGDERVSGGMEQFSLFFHGPADRLLPQGTYALEHSALGPLELFLVPVVGSNDERIVYQACFSRPAQE